MAETAALLDRRRLPGLEAAHEGPGPRSGRDRGPPGGGAVVDGRLEDLPRSKADATAPPGRDLPRGRGPAREGAGRHVRRPAARRSGFLRQISGVAPGQRLLVQVTGPAEPGKAVPVTTRLLFKCRFAIVTPDAPGLNISRRIKRRGRAAIDLAALAEAGMAGANRPRWA